MKESNILYICLPKRITSLFLFQVMLCSGLKGNLVINVHLFYLPRAQKNEYDFFLWILRDSFSVFFLLLTHNFWNYGLHFLKFYTKPQNIHITCKTSHISCNNKHFFLHSNYTQTINWLVIYTSNYTQMLKM